MRTQYLPPALLAVALSGALVMALQGCSATADAPPEGEVSAGLTAVELPKRADLVYSINQPGSGDGWEEKIAIRGFGEGSRRIDIERGARRKRTIITNARGAIDGRTEGSAVWSRIDALSAPERVGRGSAWQPFGGVSHGEQTGDALVLDQKRAFTVVDTWDVPQGTLFRAIYNVSTVVDVAAPGVQMRKLTNESWPMRDAVVAVGIADYFVASAGRHSYLLRDGEYHFATSLPTSALAISSLDDLGQRLRAEETFLTLRCLKSGPSEVLTAASALADADHAFGLTHCSDR